MQALDHSRQLQSASPMWLQRDSLRMCWETVCCRFPSPLPRISKRLSPPVAHSILLTQVLLIITNDILYFWRCYATSLYGNTWGKSPRIWKISPSHCCMLKGYAMLASQKIVDKLEQSYLEELFLVFLRFLFCFLRSFLLWKEAVFEAMPHCIGQTLSQEFDCVLVWGHIWASGKCLSIYNYDEDTE